MAEEKQKTQKSGIVKRILLWIWLGILTLLILGALIYDAPWKVLVLLLILLAAHTILPKAAVKWFCLSVAVIVVILIIWVFLPDNNEGWRPYTFDEEVTALNAKYAVPDSENAAIAYNKLFQNHNEVTFWDNLPVDEQQKLPMREPWLSKDHPKIAEWLKDQQKTIDTLIEISRIEKCRFPITAGFIEPEYMKYSPKMRSCTFLLVSSANNDIAEGRVDAALEKWLCLTRMAKHIRQQPKMIDMLVGIAIEAITTKQFNRFVVTGDATEERLSVTEQALAGIKHDWNSDWPKFYEWEKLVNKNGLCGIMYEINTEGKTRLNRDPFASSRAALKAVLVIKEDVPLRYRLRKLFKAVTILNWFYMPSTPQEATKVIDAVFERHYKTAGNQLLRQEEPRKSSIFSTKLNFCHVAEEWISILESSLLRVQDLYLRVTADNRGSQIIISLRRYKNKTGHWPESMDEIKPFAPTEIFVDPYNGGPFVYKLTDDGFKLYSRGPNNIDEDGQHKNEGPDDWPIWPPRGRKPKAEEEPQK